MVQAVIQTDRLTDRQDDYTYAWTRVNKPKSESFSSPRIDCMGAIMF